MCSNKDFVVNRDCRHGAGISAISNINVGSQVASASDADMHDDGEPALSSGTSILACLANLHPKPEAKTAEQSGFNGVTVHICWNKGQALRMNQQAKAAGVHSREATSTFGVGTCTDNLCAHTHALQGIIASGDACGSALTRGDSTGIDDMVGEAKEARTAEIGETDNPDTRGEADIESGVIVTKSRVIHGRIEKSTGYFLGEADTNTKTCEGKGMHCVTNNELCTVKHFGASEHRGAEHGAAEHFRRWLIWQLYILAIACVCLIVGMLIGRINEQWAANREPAGHRLNEDVCSIIKLCARVRGNVGGHNNGFGRAAGGSGWDFRQHSGRHRPRIGQCSRRHGRPWHWPWLKWLWLCLWPWHILGRQRLQGLKHFRS